MELEGKFYKNESYMNLYDIDGWLVVADNLDMVIGLAVNRSGIAPDVDNIKLLGHNITVIERECDTYLEATGIKN